MATDTAQSKRGLEQAISIGKDLFSLLRDGSLFLLALLLLFFPARLNSVLVSAGFEEGSIVGFKWKSRLVETNDALKDAKSTIEALQEQLKKANETLVAATSAVPAGELKDQIRKVEESGRVVVADSDGVAESARSAIRANAPLIQRVQSAQLTPSGWAVAFGSDKTLAAARDEVARASRSGIQGSGIYFRNGYFASIAVVETREQADEYLRIVKTFRSDSYVTRFSSWCASPMQRDGYIECSPTR